MELLVIAALVALTWEKSLQHRWNDFRGVEEALPAREPVVRYVPGPAPTASGDWMWDPARRSTLDRPAYDTQQPSLRYKDAAGRRYWIDAKGVRHYDQ